MQFLRKQVDGSYILYATHSLMALVSDSHLAPYTQEVERSEMSVLGLDYSMRSAVMSPRSHRLPTSFLRTLNCGIAKGGHNLRIMYTGPV